MTPYLWKLLSRIQGENHLSKGGASPSTPLSTKKRPVGDQGQSSRPPGRGEGQGLEPGQAPAGAYAHQALQPAWGFEKGQVGRGHLGPALRGLPV